MFPETKSRETSGLEGLSLKQSYSKIRREGNNCAIDQFRYIKIQPHTIDLSTRLWRINTEFVGFIPQSLVLRSFVWDWILIYRNWSIVSRSGYNWIWSGARDQESTNHSAHFVEWRSSYITIISIAVKVFGFPVDPIVVCGNEILYEFQRHDLECK